MTGDDAEVLHRWWAEVLAHGRLPAGVTAVRERLVRAVGKGDLPSGPVFVKVMAFPRVGDRLRYLLRPLPGPSEAAMLARVGAAGIACPEVVAVRVARRALVPHRSLLVLRALPVVAETAPPLERLRRRAGVARQLLDHGLFHPDLNPDNFVALADGRLAILDLQSMRRSGSQARDGQAMAARLLLEAADVDPAAAAHELASSGLVADPAGLQARAARIAWAYLRKRVERCLATSTEFVRRRRGPWGTEHRRRGALPDGRWLHGDRALLRCWLGQRWLELVDGRPPQLPALRRNSWWLAGRCAVYVPATVSEERVRDELRALTDGHARFVSFLASRQAPDLLALQSWRTRVGGESRR